jgi:hypothetical protein
MVCFFLLPNLKMNYMTGRRDIAGETKQFAKQSRGCDGCTCARLISAAEQFEFPQSCKVEIQRADPLAVVKPQNLKL